MHILTLLFFFAQAVFIYLFIYLFINYLFIYLFIYFSLLKLYYQFPIVDSELMIFQLLLFSC